MHNSTYSEIILRLSNSLVLHEKDWETRLGREAYKVIHEHGGLVRPMPSEIDGKEFHYLINNIFVRSEVLVEGDNYIINPLIDGHTVQSKKYSELQLLKCSIETAIACIRKMNNLALSNLETVTNVKVIVVGETKIQNCCFLILLGCDKDLDDKTIESFFSSPGDLKRFEKVIILSRKHEVRSNDSNFVHVAYDDFYKIPIEAFIDNNKSLRCQEVSKHFNYPLLIDQRDKFIYLFGKKIGTRTDTKLYRYINALGESQGSLPMPTETLFKIHEIAAEHYESAIKEIRSELKKKINKVLTNDSEKEQALTFLDLIADDKERGSVNIKLAENEIQVWR